MNNKAKEQALTQDLKDLAKEWEKLGIDPDAFVRCGTCHEYLIDEKGNNIPCRCERDLVD